MSVINPSTDEPRPLESLRVAFWGKLGGFTRREAQQLVRQHGGQVADQLDERVQLLVIGADELPLGPLADGGEFTIGGTGGTDSQTVGLKLSPRERLIAVPPGDQLGGQASGDVVIQIDARGAEVGVEQRIQIALRQAMQDPAFRAAVRRDAVEAVRAGRRSDPRFFGRG